MKEASTTEVDLSSDHNSLLTLLVTEFVLEVAANHSIRWETCPHLAVELLNYSVIDLVLAARETGRPALVDGGEGFRSIVGCHSIDGEASSEHQKSVSCFHDGP